jgi:hypothetical protein
MVSRPDTENIEEMKASIFHQSVVSFSSGLRLTLTINLQQWLHLSGSFESCVADQQQLVSIELLSPMSVHTVEAL